MNFHYHSPSEHTINLQHFDMEVQHVHIADDGQLLVISVMVKVGKENKYLKQFWTSFPMVLEGSGVYGDYTLASMAPQWHHLLPYRNFMPVDKSYYHYMGTDTTPPCSIDVIWVVLKETVEMSEEQLNIYRRQINSTVKPYNQLHYDPELRFPGVNKNWDYNLGTNARPIQVRGSRKVYLYELHFGPLRVISSIFGASSSPMFFLLMLLGVLLLCCFLSIVYMTVQGCVCANASKRKTRGAGNLVEPKDDLQNPAEFHEQQPLIQMHPSSSNESFRVQHAPSNRHVLGGR